MTCHSFVEGIDCILHHDSSFNPRLYSPYAKLPIFLDIIEYCYIRDWAA